MICRKLLGMTATTERPINERVIRSAGCHCLWSRRCRSSTSADCPSGLRSTFCPPVQKPYLVSPDLGASVTFGSQLTRTACPSSSRRPARSTGPGRRASYCWLSSGRSTTRTSCRPVRHLQTPGQTVLIGYGQVNRGDTTPRSSPSNPPTMAAA